MGIPGKEFRGVVVPGRGFGAQRMANPAVLHTAQRLTALTLVPGTLNVRLPQPFDGLLPWYQTEADLGGNVWRDHAPNRTGIRCGEVLIPEFAVYRHLRTRDPYIDGISLPKKLKMHRYMH
jgi:hypothetical protein